MRPTPIPTARPAREPDVIDVLPADKPQRHKRPARSGFFPGAIGAVFGWLWRLGIGALLCMNFFTSILVTGWTYRWIQGCVLRSWWKRSRQRYEGSFEDFCAMLGPEAPVTRPRWFLQERIGAMLHRPGPDGATPGLMRQVLRALVVPWHSLWQNAFVGGQALFCTFLLTGWGCLVMHFSWEFGWLNSFNKGYEQALWGPLTGFLGIALFIVAMFYVPMAQVHQAVTGDMKAFFDFPFIWRLIQARPFRYVGVAAGLALASVPFEVLKTVPTFFGDHTDFWSTASGADVHAALQRYFLISCAFLFPTVLLVRFAAALVYRSAVEEVLRRGWIASRDLHPVLREWFARLDLYQPLPAIAPRFRVGAGSLSWWLVGVVDLLVFVVAFAALLLGGLGAWLIVLGVWVFLTVLASPFTLFRRGGLAQYLHFNGRRLVFGLLFWIWFLFVAKVYVGEFLMRHPLEGFLNHPLVQAPYFNFTPPEAPPMPRP
jgi:hypothetical protein